MRLIIALIISFMTTLPLLAESSQVHRTPPQEYLNPDVLLKSLDSNNDGRLNYLEAMADSEISDRFLQMDTNKNGFLSLNELSVPKKMDANQLKVLLTFASLQCI
ncbi:EF-hand domain-containing protein [Neptunomonas japonica]|uniref:EF-hand domain-containing protein n=1 Tax=Neptunomonas japonica JAMM 1380 TaxID=1441457 RepID=A0A7R6PK01_9GAMM|nr:EF-hand domain-containing protein [Neptunomonas japonica]BBB30531.1 conserved hypothetical protein [Neptunomonas japonica JAMM 1380]